jgi:hypothetical protein
VRVGEDENAQRLLFRSLLVRHVRAKIPPKKSCTTPELFPAS